MEIKIDKYEWYASAEKFFIEMSGLNKEGARFEKMRKSAEKMIHEAESRVDAKTACEYFDAVTFDGTKAMIADTEFECTAFRQIEPDTVEGAFIYAVSAGDFVFPEENILNQVYVDLWGTALTEALSLECRRELEKQARLSDSFGPGFYGMDVSNMGKIAKILDFEKLGLEIRNSSVILPLKSCAGIYFKVTDLYRHLRKACAHCAGIYKNCVLCRQARIETNV